jgi:hypothetical protein
MANFEGEVGGTKVFGSFLQNRTVLLCYLRTVLGSRRMRKALPRAFTEMTRAVIARPGKVGYHHATVR